MTIVEQCRAFIASKSMDSIKSVQSYENALAQFTRFMVQEKITAINIATGAAYRTNMRARGLSDNTIRHYIAVLKQFSTWRHINIPGSVDFAKGLKVPRAYDGYKKKPLNDTQLRKLAALLQTDTMTAARNRAIVMLMLTLALRCVEVSRLNVSDIYDDDGVITIRIQGKGHTEKDFSTEIPVSALDAVNDYLVMRQSFTNDSALFVSHNPGYPGRLSPKEVGHVVTRMLNAIGLTSREYTAHSLRHTTASRLLLQGYPINDVKVFMRHRSIRYTELYVRSAEQLRIRMSRPERVFDEILKTPETLAKDVELT